MTDKEPDLDKRFEPVRTLAMNEILGIFDFNYDLSLTDKQSY